MRLPSRTPTDFELAIFRRLFLPVLVLGGLFGYIASIEDRCQCRRICEERQFHDYDYVTPYAGAACYCVSMEQDDNGNRWRRYRRQSLPN